MDCAQEMPADAKQIQHDAVYGQETLCVGDGCEASHLALALARGLVRGFRPIVRVLLRAVHDGRHHCAVGRRVAAELIRDQPPRSTALSFQ